MLLFVEGLKGVVTSISFDLKDVQGKDVFVDFHGEKIESLCINRQPISDISFNQHKIKLPLENLVQIGNTIVIKYENSYSN